MSELGVRHRKVVFETQDMGFEFGQKGWAKSGEPSYAK